nr:piggyBac transposable element-derived protein 4-like [Leptinotarsa decemlineata]
MCPPKNVRTRQHNIISKLPEVIGDAKNASTKEQCWDLFVNAAITMNIVECINIYIETIANRYQDSSDVRPITITELKALFGLLYLIGVYHSGRTSIFEFWATDGTGIVIFPATVALRRCLRFDNKHTREERKREDTLAPIRYVFEAVVKNFQKCYSIVQYSTIDEILLAFRGRCSFRMYIPNKPARYGLKVFSLADTRTFYTLNLEIYAGKQPEGPYRVSNAAYDVVERIVKPITKSNRNITMDNWFTSVECAEN